ncbi:hypothetical protein DL96DRAFT_1606840, partial [Flagelloscypha sp. PMI_526]
MSLCELNPTDTTVKLVSSTSVQTFTSWSVSTIFPNILCNECSDKIAGRDFFTLRLTFYNVLTISFSVAGTVTLVPHPHRSTGIVVFTSTNTLYGPSCASPTTTGLTPAEMSFPAPTDSPSPHIVTRTQTVTAIPLDPVATTLTTTVHSADATLTTYEPTLQTGTNSGLPRPPDNSLARAIGGAVGAVCGVIVLGCLLYYLSRRRQLGLSAQQVSVLAEAGMFNKPGPTGAKPYDYGRVGSGSTSPLEYPSSVVHSRPHSRDAPADPSVFFSSPHTPLLGGQPTVYPTTSIPHGGLHRNATVSSSTLPSLPATSHLSTDPLLSHQSATPTTPFFPDTSLLLPPAMARAVSETSQDTESVILERPPNAWRVTNPNLSQQYLSSTEALENENHRGNLD